MTDFSGKDSVNTAKRKEKQIEINRLHEKTFRTWINFHLKGSGVVVSDLMTDLSDGIKLVRILEVLSGEKCPGKLNLEPKMDVHKLDNIALAIEFCNKFIAQLSLRSQDFLEGNAKAILGLFWRMILHFQVTKHQDHEEGLSAAKKLQAAKRKLLEWCQKQTAGHQHCNIENLQSSWFDGMGFCALVHSFDDSFIDYDSLDPTNAAANLELAFRIAEEKLDIPRLLDPADILNADPSLRPDEQCVITYLSEFPIAFLAKKDHDEKKRGLAELEEQKRRAEEEEARRKREAEEAERRRKEEEERRAEEELRRQQDEAARKIEEEKRRAEEEHKRAEENRLREEAERLKREEEEAKLAAAHEKTRQIEEQSEEELEKARLLAEEEARKRREAEEAFEEERRRLKAEADLLRAKYEGARARLIGKLKVVIIEARGLKSTNRIGGKSDPYCVLFLERQKEKTRTVKKTLNPRWEAEFEFFVSEATAALEISIFDWNRFLHDEFLGKVIIPTQSLPDGKDVDEWFTLEGNKKSDKVTGEVKLRLCYRKEA